MFSRYKTNLLKSKQLKQLKEHKYSSSGESILENAMQKIWRRQIEYIPLWIAPNVLTLAGLAANAFTCLILMAYSPDAKHNIPKWASILCALGLFIYQSLDALDGKQARRTNSSSPLGELFDHGCDSLSAVFAMLSVCVTTKLGTSTSLMVLMAVLTLFVFYTAHWQTYVSGKLLFTSLNVTEAQISVMIVLMISGIFGTVVWEEIPGLKNSILFIAIIGSAYISWSYMVIVFTGGAGKNKSTIADTSVLSPIFPFGLMAFAAVAIFNKSISPGHHTHPWSNGGVAETLLTITSSSNIQTSYFQQNICLYILLFGLVISKLTDNLVIAHMTKSDLPMVDSIFLGPGILALNQYYNHILPEKYVLWVAFAYTVFDLGHYLITICTEISVALKIPVFTIPKNPVSSATCPQTFLANASNGSTSTYANGLSNKGSIKSVKDLPNTSKIKYN